MQPSLEFELVSGTWQVHGTSEELFFLCILLYLFNFISIWFALTLIDLLHPIAFDCIYWIYCFSIGINRIIVLFWASSLAGPADVSIEHCKPRAHPPSSRVRKAVQSRRICIINGCRMASLSSLLLRKIVKESSRGSGIMIFINLRHASCDIMCDVWDKLRGLECGKRHISCGIAASFCAWWRPWGLDECGKLW